MLQLVPWDCSWLEGLPPQNDSEIQTLSISLLIRQPPHRRGNEHGEPCPEVVQIIATCVALAWAQLQSHPIAMEARNAVSCISPGGRGSRFGWFPNSHCHDGFYIRWTASHWWKMDMGRKHGWRAICSLPHSWFFWILGKGNPRPAHGESLLREERKEKIWRNKIPRNHSSCYYWHACINLKWLSRIKGS